MTWSRTQPRFRRPWSEPYAIIPTSGCGCTAAGRRVLAGNERELLDRDLDILRTLLWDAPKAQPEFRRHHIACARRHRIFQHHLGPAIESGNLLAHVDPPRSD